MDSLTTDEIQWIKQLISDEQARLEQLIEDNPQADATDWTSDLVKLEKAYDKIELMRKQIVVEGGDN